MSVQKERRLPRWYFGGLSSAGAVLCTHPLDLIKVHLQTQQERKLGVIQVTKNILKKEGVPGLFAGLSASMLRQFTYSMTRFGIYEVVKQRTKSESFGAKVAIAAMAGAAGGLVGTPADLVNVRMQNDVKLPPEKRRNYKHAIDGLFRVCKEEGIREAFAGASTATGRAIFMTIGQLSFYDQVKVMLLHSGLFKDNPTTHVFSSFVAGVVSTVITQPLDVLKTRMMSSTPRPYTSTWDCIQFTASVGPLAFYKGFVPSLVRMLPTTILIFIIFEQLRLNFGYDPDGVSRK